MGTRYRALAAPVDVSTGDQRRFAEGAIQADTLPMPLRMARSDVGGHDGAVVVGRIDTVEMGPEIWTTVTMFDDVDPAVTPRLAEDVAEAMKLMDEGVVGLSVDLDDVEAQVVRAGTDEPATEDDFLDGPDADIELLITQGRIRSATLVAIPAFSETGGAFQRLADAEPVEGEEVEPEKVPELAAVIAALGETGPVFDVEAFVAPEIKGLTPITYDWERGIAYGHIAPWGICHAGIADACVLAPRDQGEYRDFHTHRVPTTDGVVYAGRITAGGVHPDIGDDITAHHVRQHHDQLTTVAYVRAHEDEHGIFVCGPLVPDLDEATREILSRRKVSADWRETDAGLSMVEVLALGPGPRAVSEPGFPVRMGFAGGRQVALVASLVPAPGERGDVEEPEAKRPFADFALSEIVRKTYTAIREEEAAEADRRVRAEALRAELAAAMQVDADRVRAELATTIGV